MNTDNFSLAGITIDYGPCAFMDEFKFHKFFSFVDRKGRYSFFNQVPIAKWNILKLAESLLPLIDNNEDTAVKTVENELSDLFQQFDEKRMSRFAEKMGINDYQKTDKPLVLNFLKYLEEESLDFTLAFRNLVDLFSGESSFYPNTPALVDFTAAWKNRVTNVDRLNEINPIYIPRNHQVQKVIEDAYQGNFDSFHKLLAVTSNPYISVDEHKDFARGPKPDERVYQTFCGT